MEESINFPGERKWQELREFPGNGEVTVLREEGKSGAKTIIVRLPAGGQIIPHSHVAAVQHYVLEGEYESQGKTLAQGAYRYLPKHADVSTISSKNGATILMIYDALNE